MSWIDLFSIVGLLLAVGAALDFVIRPTAKKSFVALILKVTTRGKQYAYAGTNALDTIFGNGLLSLKAVSRYAAISLISISVSYFFAWCTTPIVPGGDVLLFPGKRNFVDVLILAICVAFAVLGDIASYSITRVFVRAVDSHRNAVVAVGLVVADFISSLFLFFFTFSLSRVFCYLLVIYSGGQSIVSSTTSYLPEMVAEGVNATRVSVGGDRPMSNSELARMVAQVQVGTLRDLAGWMRKNELGRLAGTPKFDFIHYTASLNCISGPASYDRIIPAMSGSGALLEASAKENGDDKYDPSNLSLAWTKKLLSEQKSCLTKELIITREMPVGGLVGVAGPGDTYLAAVERTLFDAYQIMGFKLAPYISFNPRKSLQEYAESISQMESTSFLGMNDDADPGRVMVSQIYARSLQSQEIGGVNVPFSPMVASSLASSIAFLLYLTSLGVAWMTESLRVLIRKLVPKLDLDMAPFTTVGLAVGSVYLSINFLGRVFESLWTWLFI